MKFFSLALAVSAFATDYNTSLPRGYFWSSFGKVSVDVYGADYAPVTFVDEEQRSCLVDQLKALNETIALVQPKAKAIHLFYTLADKAPNKELTEQVIHDGGELRVVFAFNTSGKTRGERCLAFSADSLRERFTAWQSMYSETSTNLKDFPAIQAEMNALSKSVGKTAKK